MSAKNAKKEIPWDEVEKDLKFQRFNGVILSKEEIERIKLTTSKNIEIAYFVDAFQIDPIFFEKTYYLVPMEAGLKPYSIFVEAFRLLIKLH